MRLLTVIDSLTGSGGAEHGLVREATRFSSAVDHTVVRLFAADTREPDLLAAGVAVVPLGFDASSAGTNWPLAAWRLGQVIADVEPDVIQSSLFTGNIVGQLAGRRAKVPVVSTWVLSGDVDLLKATQPGAATWKGAALRRVASTAARSDRVWFRALTRDTLDTNAALLGVDPDRGVVIPRGVPIPDPGRPIPARSDLGLPEDVSLLVNVGRQTAQKGHHHLLDVLEAIPDTHLVILGRTGDATDRFAAAISDRGLVDRVTTIEFTAAVVDHLSHASVFVFPSLMEGLGTAVLEAMAAGAPVVAFDIPPVADVTDGGRHARLVPVGDIGAFIDAVRRTLDDGGLAESAHRWVVETYAIDAVAPRVEAYLTEVAGR